MKILVTGAAGFIGFHVTQALLARGNEVIGLDNLNEYYDVNLKLARLEQIKLHANFTFIKMDITDQTGLSQLLSDNSIEYVIHLAAQAGVRYSIDNPQSYVNSNLVGFANILECCRHNQIKHLVYASTSSVYGANTTQPFSEHHGVDHPVSFYAATKKANEAMAHSYASLYQLPCTGVRFFTVYGPWGRPDMALFKFAKAIVNDKAIDLYNSGDMVRDFTYVSDVAQAIIQLLNQTPKGKSNWQSNMPDPATSYAPYQIFNIGCGNPQPLLTFVAALEKALGKKAKRSCLPMQAGDVPSTAADTQLLNAAIAYKPSTSIEEGINEFVKWYLNDYKTLQSENKIKEQV